MISYFLFSYYFGRIFCSIIYREGVHVFLAIYNHQKPETTGLAEDEGLAKTHHISHVKLHHFLDLDRY
jgi:hypothetical protein